jgi:hypothetical protein
VKPFTLDLEEPTPLRPLAPQWDWLYCWTADSEPDDGGYWLNHLFLVPTSGEPKL